MPDITTLASVDAIYQEHAKKRRNPKLLGLEEDVFAIEMGARLLPAIGLFGQAGHHAISMLAARDITKEHRLLLEQTNGVFPNGDDEVSIAAENARQLAAKTAAHIITERLAQLADNDPAKIEYLVRESQATLGYSPNAGDQLRNVLNQFENPALTFAQEVKRRTSHPSESATRSV